VRWCDGVCVVRVVEGLLCSAVQRRNSSVSVLEMVWLPRVSITLQKDSENNRPCEAEIRKLCTTSAREFRLFACFTISATGTVAQPGGIRCSALFDRIGTTTQQEGYCYTAAGLLCGRQTTKAPALTRHSQKAKPPLSHHAKLLGDDNSGPAPTTRRGQQPQVQ
jgi:hypothetical protein